MEKAGCRFDEKTENHVDSSTNFAGALYAYCHSSECAADLLWQGGISPVFAVP